MPSYDIEGQIKVIDFMQTFDSGFTKREFVITTEEKFPQDIKLELVKDKCDLIDKYSVGDWLKVGFNMRGNEYNDKYYVNLVAWRLEPAEGHQTVAESEKDGDDARAEAASNTASTDEDSDPDSKLPF